MNNNDVNLGIKITADADNAKQSLNETSAELDKTAASADKTSFSFLGLTTKALSLASGLVSVTTNLARMAANYLGLSVEVETSNKKLKVFDIILQSFRKEFTLSLGFLKQFADVLRSLDFPLKPLANFVDLLGDFRLKIGIGKGEKNSIDEVNDSIKESEIVISKMQFMVTHAVAGLATLIAKTIAWGYELKHAISQEKGFADADRMFEGTAQEIEHLNNQLKELSVSKLAMPIEEIQHLAKVAGSMGKSADEVKDFIQTSSEAALSFIMPAEEMMSALGGIQSAIGLTNEQLPTFTDQVKIAADTIGGMTTEAGIMQVLADGVGQAGKLMGLTAGETVAFSSTMLSLDGNVSKSANTLSSFLFSLKNVNGQNKAFQATFEQLGIPIDKFTQDVKNKPVQAITALLEKIKTLSKEGQVAAITGLVGNNVQQQAGLSGLIGNLDTLKTQLNATADSEIYAGGVHEAYEKKLDTADAKIQLMKNSLTLLSGALMSPFLPAVKLATDGITDFSNWIRKSAENSPFLEIILKSVSVFLSLGGAIHLVSYALPLLGTALRFVTGGFGFLAVSANRVSVALGLSTFSVGGLTTALRTYIATNVAAVVATNRLSFSLAGAWNAVKLLGSGLKWLVGGAFGLIGIAVTAAVVSLVYLSDQVSTLGSTTAKNSEIAKAAFSVLFDYLREAVKPVLALFNELNATVTVFFGGIKSKALDMGEAFDLLMQKVFPFYEALKKAYALLEKSGVVKKFKVDIEEEIKRNQEQAKALANPDKPTLDTGTDLPATQSDEAIKEAKKQDDLVTKIQKEQREQVLTAIRQTEADKIRVLEASGKTQQQIDAAIFRVKIETAKAISVELKKQLNEESQALIAHANKTKVLSQDELLAKKETLKQTENAYKSHIDALNALEKDHHDKAIALDKDIRDVKKQGAMGERDIARAGMTDAQVFQDKANEITEKKSQFNALMRKKDYAEAAELGKELNGLVKDQGMESVKNAAAGNKRSAAISAQYEYKESIKLTTQALEAQKAEELKKANEVKAQAESLRKTFEMVGMQIAALNETLTKGTELKIAVDTSEVDAAMQKIDGLNGESTNVTTQKTIDKEVQNGKTAYRYAPPATKTLLPDNIRNSIQQLQPLAMPSLSANQAANPAGNENVLGVYKLELASPAGTVNATIKPADKEIFEAYQRYAKSHGRMTREAS